MSDQSPQEKRKLEKLARIVEEGEVAIVEHLLEVEEKMEAALAEVEKAKEEIKKSVPDVKSVLEQVKGKDSDVPGPPGRDGDDGRDGYTPVKGLDYFDGEPGKTPVKGVDYFDGEPGKDGETPEIDYDLIILEALAQIPKPENGKDGSPDTGDEIVAKINLSNKLIKKEHIEGLVDAINNIKHRPIESLPITTAFYNGLRAKNLTIVGGTATLRGDTVFVTVTGTGGGQVDSIVAGTGITVDDTDPANPIVSATATAINFSENETPSGTIDEVNKDFTIANTPVAGSLKVYLNGTRQQIVGDYTLSGTTISFVNAPLNGSILIADYRY